MGSCRIAGPTTHRHHGGGGSPRGSVLVAPTDTGMGGPVGRPRHFSELAKSLDQDGRVAVMPPPPHAKPNSSQPPPPPPPPQVHETNHPRTGSNLSQGQRQLVSLARAMLTPSNILVLDEATAAVDVQTDALLQTTLRGPLFANRTIVTVAHRINTIMDSDRVVVLEKGEVVEFDTPAELVKRKGVFWGLVKEAGLLEE